MGELHVSFHAPAYLRRNEESPGVVRPDDAETSDGQVVHPLLEQVELTEEQRVLLREAELAQLMADDPVAYEQAVIDDNLRDENVSQEDAG